MCSRKVTASIRYSRKLSTSRRKRALYPKRGAHHVDQCRRGNKRLKLLAEKVYILPTGYKVRLIKPAEGRRWRLIGTAARGHPLPQAVHRLRRRQIRDLSKSIADVHHSRALLLSPTSVRTLKEVDKLLQTREYGNRFKDAGPPPPTRTPHSPSPERTLGSVIKLLTPSDEFTDEYNAFLDSVPPHIKELILPS